MVLKKAISKAEDITRDFKKEFKNQIIIAVTTAFAFLIALTWRDAISESVNKVITSLNLSSNLYFYRVLSAMLVTLISVIGIF